MSLFQIAWRYVWQRRLVTTLTLLSIALGAALISGVLTVNREIQRSLDSDLMLFDLVVGAKGSPLQLVLSSVYHVDIPTGNIPYARYEALREDRRVRAAFPIGLGDNYEGFRIVGAYPHFFDLTRRDDGNREGTPVFSMREGRRFETDFEAVLGHEVARVTGLSLGDTFSGVHGLVALAGAEAHDEFPYTVVGILAPSGTANDRAIFCSLASVWLVHDYEEETHQRIAGVTAEAVAAPEREVTAVLLQLGFPGLRIFMEQEIKEETEAMAAIPINEMHRLYQMWLGRLQTTMLGVAYLVVVVSALTILTTLYQSAERRRRDLALMRALGAHPLEIFVVVLLEAVFLSLLGIALGWLLGHGAVAIVGASLQAKAGIVLQAWGVDQRELIALGVVALAGVLAGLLPALIAYRRAPNRDLAAGG